MRCSNQLSVLSRVFGPCWEKSWRKRRKVKRLTNQRAFQQLHHHTSSVVFPNRWIEQSFSFELIYVNLKPNNVLIAVCKQSIHFTPEQLSHFSWNRVLASWVLVKSASLRVGKWYEPTINVHKKQYNASTNKLCLMTKGLFLRWVTYQHTLLSTVG